MRRFMAVVFAAMVLTLSTAAISVLADTTPGPQIPATIQITSAKILARGAAAGVGIDLVCEACAGGPDWMVEYGYAEINQASGRSIGYGAGQIPFGAAVTCDGTTVAHFDTVVKADTVPFKPTAALVGATICMWNLDNYQSDGCVDASAVTRLKNKRSGTGDLDPIAVTPSSDRTFVARRTRLPDRRSAGTLRAARCLPAVGRPRSCWSERPKRRGRRGRAGRPRDATSRPDLATSPRAVLSCTGSSRSRSPPSRWS